MTLDSGGGEKSRADFRSELVDTDEVSGVDFYVSPSADGATLNSRLTDAGATDGVVKLEGGGTLVTEETINIPSGVTLILEGNIQAAGSATLTQLTDDQNATHDFLVSVDGSTDVTIISRGGYLDANQANASTADFTECVFGRDCHDLTLKYLELRRYIFGTYLVDADDMHTLKCRNDGSGSNGLIGEEACKRSLHEGHVATGISGDDEVVDLNGLSENPTVREIRGDGGTIVDATESPGVTVEDVKVIPTTATAPVAVHAASSRGGTTRFTTRAAPGHMNNITIRNIAGGDPTADLEPKDDNPMEEIECTGIRNEGGDGISLIGINVTAGTSLTEGSVFHCHNEGGTRGFTCGNGPQFRAMQVSVTGANFGGEAINAQDLRESYIHVDIFDTAEHAIRLGEFDNTCATLYIDGQMQNVGTSNTNTYDALFCENATRVFAEFQLNSNGKTRHAVNVDASSSEIRANVGYVGTESAALNDAGTRTIFNGLGTNGGDPSAGGQWNGNGREGLIVRDTTNANTYIYNNGTWSQIASA